MDAAARTLTAAFDRLVQRARVLAAAEAAGWGAAIAAISPAVGAFAAILVGVWAARRTNRASLVRRVDRAAGGRTYSSPPTNWSGARFTRAPPLASAPR